MSLHTLPVPTQSQLRSTQLLTSLPQLVSELVQNALDARASSVSVSVDCAGWECTVRDDGTGISPRGLDAIRLGRYHTSKAYEQGSLDNVSTFGFRGEALASAADVACMEIASRTAQARECMTVILKGGKCLYDGPSTRWRRERPGTTVCLRDIFYNLPIRRTTHPSPSKTLELIRREIASFALVFPGVAFTLDDLSRARDEQSFGASSSRARSDGGRVMSVPKTTSIVGAFRSLFGRSLVERVEEVSVSRGDVVLTGFISLAGALTKTHQYLYINRHPIEPCHLHRAIDAEFSKSNFGRHADPLDSAAPPNASQGTTTNRSPRKNSARKPVYVLDLGVPSANVDNCVEPAKTLVHLINNDEVTNLVASVARAFLVKHGYAAAGRPGRDGAENRSRPSARRKRRRLDRPPSSSSPSPSSSADERRSRRASPQARERARHPSPPRVCPVNQTDDNAPLAPVRWRDPSTGALYAVDARTGHTLPCSTLTKDGRINANANEGENGEGEGEGVRVGRQRRTIPLVVPDGGKSALEGGGGAGTGKGKEREAVPAWIVDALRHAEGTAFRQTERPIPSTQPVGTSALAAADPCPESGQDSALTQTQKSQTVSRATLAAARVLAQVDRKFILLSLPASASSPGETGETETEGGGGRTLALVDQHAASERVRVERFLAELCSSPPLPPGSGSGGVALAPGGRGVALMPPRRVVLNGHEAEVLKRDEGDGGGGGRVRRAMAVWGLDVDVDTGGEDTTGACRRDEDQNDALEGGKEEVQVQALVKSVPGVVAEKLVASPRALHDLIVGFVAAWEAGELVDGGDPLSTATTSQFDESKHDSDANFAWQAAARTCPRVLVDMVNSRACRGAIMFNDAMTPTQCARLVAQLARTAFPFVCAHGRPAMVVLGGIERGSGFEERGEEGVRVKRRGRGRGGEVNWKAFCGER